MTNQTKYKILKVSGYSIMCLSTLGAFFGYEASTNFETFKTSLENFQVVSEESYKLNPYFAFPLIIGVIVVLFITLKKNKDFLKGKTTLGLMITAGVFYLLYSIITVAMITLL